MQVLCPRTGRRMKDFRNINESDMGSIVFRGEFAHQ